MSEKTNNFWNTTLKIIIAVFSIVIALFFIFGLIGRAFETLFKNEGKRVDKMMSNLVVSKTIKDSKTFKKIANKKSIQYFGKYSIAPVFILFLALIGYVIYGAIIGFAPGLLWYHSTSSGPTGIGTLFYVFNFDNIKYFPPIGFGLKDETLSLFLNTPHFETIAIGSYIIVPLLLIGIIWYVYNVFSFIARQFRINKLSKTIYSKNLDEVDLTTLLNTEKLTVIPKNEETQN